jgi:RimJ/RimL family protein N-acetyltransferase
MDIRKLEEADAERLEAFLREIPEDDRTFFKEDLADPETVRSLTGERRGLRFVALDEGGRIGGYIRVLPGTGLSSHVGEIRLVVAPTRRRSGVGRELARRALVEAVGQLGLRKLFVEVVAEQDGAVAMFQALCFQAEGLLRDHVRDRDGELRDLILLAHPVSDQWEAMATVGIDGELG